MRWTTIALRRPWARGARSRAPPQAGRELRAAPRRGGHLAGVTYVASCLQRLPRTASAVLIVILHATYMSLCIRTVCLTTVHHQTLTSCACLWHTSSMVPARWPSALRRRAKTRPTPAPRQVTRLQAARRGPCMQSQLLGRAERCRTIWQARRVVERAATPAVAHAGAHMRCRTHASRVPGTGMGMQWSETAHTRWARRRQVSLTTACAAKSGA